MSFRWLGTFRQGQWQAYRRFVLQERRDVGARLAVIEAEKERIGRVVVTYVQEEDGDGNRRATEKRKGFSITPPTSSLAKLMSAYTAMGGCSCTLTRYRPTRTG